MEKEKKEIAVNIKMGAITVEKIDYIASQVMRSRSQIIRLIIDNFLSRVDRGEIEISKGLVGMDKGIVKHTQDQ